MDIDRRFHNTQQAIIALLVTANITDFGFRKGATGLTVTDMFYGLEQGVGELFAAIPIMFQQMKGHTLGRLGPYARQAAQVFNQALDEWTKFHSG
jgi:hypothetical protein